MVRVAIAVGYIGGLLPVCCCHSQSGLVDNAEVLSHNIKCGESNLGYWGDRIAYLSIIYIYLDICTYILA